VSTGCIIDVGATNAYSVSTSHAADIAEDVRKGSSSPSDSNGGYFELGIGASLYQSDEDLANPITAGFRAAGAYRYKRVFLEASAGSFDGISLGYNIANAEGWSLDILAASAKAIRRFKDREVENLTPRDNSVLNRTTFYNGAGFRFTQYFDNVVVQYRLVSDTYKQSGVTSSVRLGYSRQLRNWNLHSIISADYISSKTSNYWYAVSNEESSAKFQPYTVNTFSMEYAGEIGVTYPLRENVVFRSTGRLTLFDSLQAKSPLVNSDYGFLLNTSISYVF